jgi:hypothetical protein
MHFKQLTLANWDKADPVNAIFGRLSRLVGPRRMSGHDWAREFLSIELGPQVPDHVQDLFAVARGAMLYGWFFYPVYLLAEEQLHRVLETAVRTRYQELGGGRRRPAFAHAIEWLIDRKVISPNDKERWDGIRVMRNAASHPEHQDVMPPGAVLRTLRETAHDINRLFARDVGGIPRQRLDSPT